MNAAQLIKLIIKPSGTLFNLFLKQLMQVYSVNSESLL